MSPLDCFQPFLSPPVILVTPSHKTPERPQDAMAVWMEDSRKDSFKICLKESKIFDGVHKDIKVVSLLHIKWIKKSIPFENDNFNFFISIYNSPQLK